MNFKLENVVPWGRSLQDYKGMFNLSPTDLSKKILDCASGPSSFNSEMTQLGHSVVSCDPIYQFTVKEIQSRINETYPVIIEGLKTNYDLFVWDGIATPENLGEMRLNAMNQFLEDVSQGLAEKRYICAELPNLPFENKQFDLALCAHLLFTYSEQFSLEFHQKAIEELGRVAKEVRIFPLLENFTGEMSRHLNPIQDWLQECDISFKMVTVPYEFQKGGNQMLCVNFNSISFV